MTNAAEHQKLQPQVDAAQQLGFNALRGAAEQHEPHQVPIVVPRGWTTLVHGTDTLRWQIGEPTKLVTGMGLSAVTAEEVDRNMERAIAVGNPGAYDTTRSYAGSRSSDAQPVEVRVLFYREDLAGSRVPAKEVADIKAGLDPDTQELVTKYYPSRHPVVPRNETLIRFGTTMVDEESGRLIEYFIPKSVATDYLVAVAIENAAANTAHTSPVPH